MYCPICEAYGTVTTTDLTEIVHEVDSGLTEPLKGRLCKACAQEVGCGSFDENDWILNPDGIGATRYADGAKLRHLVRCWKCFSVGYDHLEADAATEAAFFGFRELINIVADSYSANGQPVCDNCIEEQSNG